MNPRKRKLKITPRSACETQDFVEPRRPSLPPSAKRMRRHSPPTTVFSFDEPFKKPEKKTASVRPRVPHQPSSGAPSARSTFRRRRPPPLDRSDNADIEEITQSIKALPSPKTFSKKVAEERCRILDSCCSCVCDGLYVGGAKAARSISLLKKLRITHILNLAVEKCGNYFPVDFQYFSADLRDNARQDITCFVYLFIDFIDKARAAGGSVLVHCWKGISRSPAVAGMYLMWKHAWPFEKAYLTLKRARACVNPNPAFVFQMLEWYKLRPKMSNRTCVYRLLLQSAAPGSRRKAETTLPSLVGPLTDVSLDLCDKPAVAAQNEALSACLLQIPLLRGGTPVKPSTPGEECCLIVASPTAVFVLQGRRMTARQKRAAETMVTLLAQLEGTSPTVTFAVQGEEPVEFWRVLKRCESEIVAMRPELLAMVESNCIDELPEVEMDVT